MNDKKLEAQLQEEMMAAFLEAKRLKYNATRFSQMLSVKGALGTAKILLAGDENKVSDGFTAMWELQRLDLTVEAICIQPKFKPLFTEQELATARKRLDNADYKVPTIARSELIEKKVDAGDHTCRPKQKLRVFLCHSSADKAAVRDLYRRLQNDGFAPWLDEQDLIPGQNWQQEIPKAVRDSHVVLVCISRSSITKEGYVQREIKFALDVAEEKPDGTIFLIPTRLEEVRAPDRLKHLHWVNLFEVNGYEKLLNALNTRSTTLGIPPDRKAREASADRTISFSHDPSSHQATATAPVSHKKQMLSLKAIIRHERVPVPGGGEDERYKLLASIENDGQRAVKGYVLDIEFPESFLDEGSHMQRIQSRKPGFARFQSRNSHAQLYPGEQTRDLITFHYAVRDQVKRNSPGQLQEELTATVFSENMQPQKMLLSISELRA